MQIDLNKLFTETIQSVLLRSSQHGIDIFKMNKFNFSLI